MGQKAFSIFLASFTAPIFPGVLFAVATPIETGQKDWTSLILPKLGMFTVGYIITLNLVLLFALPLFLFAERRGWVRWWSALLAGCVVGLLVAVSLRATTLPPMGDIIFGLGNGIAVSMTFWLVLKLMESLFRSSN